MPPLKNFIIFRIFLLLIYLFLFTNNPLSELAKHRLLLVISSPSSHTQKQTRIAKHHLLLFVSVSTRNGLCNVTITKHQNVILCQALDKGVPQDMEFQNIKILLIINSSNVYFLNKVEFKYISCYS